MSRKTLSLKTLSLPVPDETLRAATTEEAVAMAQLHAAMNAQSDANSRSLEDWQKLGADLAAHLRALVAQRHSVFATESYFGALKRDNDATSSALLARIEALLP